jgi:hypothetical protein
MWWNLRRSNFISKSNNEFKGKEILQDMELKIKEWLIAGVFSFLIFNLGFANLIKPQEYNGVITIVLSFVLIYFFYYANKIKENEKENIILTQEIVELKKDMINLKGDLKLKEEKLNTLRDIILLKKK